MSKNEVNREMQINVTEGFLFNQIGTRESTYDEFLTDLCAKDGEADDCRYAIYDFEFVVQSAGAEASNR